MTDDYTVKDSGKRMHFESGMQRDVTEGKIDYSLVLDGPLIQRLAEHLMKGAVKYDKRNWMKANGSAEEQRFMESAFRHFLQWWWRMGDEDHFAATIFNMNGAEYVREKMREVILEHPNNDGPDRDLLASHVPALSPGDDVLVRDGKVFAEVGDLEGDVMDEGIDWNPICAECRNELNPTDLAYFDRRGRKVCEPCYKQLFAEQEARHDPKYGHLEICLRCHTPIWSGLDHPENCAEATQSMGCDDEMSADIGEVPRGYRRTNSSPTLIEASRRFGKSFRANLPRLNKGQQLPKNIKA